MISTPVQYYPNRMVQIILQAMEEVLGHNEVTGVLNQAHLPDRIHKDRPGDQDGKFHFNYVGRVQTALEGAYGSRAGGGLSVRVGRACVKYGLREFGSELGITDLGFRLLPLPTRLKVGSKALAEFFNKFTDQSVRLEVNDKQIFWHIERCPLCLESREDGPCCSMTVGFLQEALYWVSGGKTFLVEEKKCIACGDNDCTIVMEQVAVL